MATVTTPPSPQRDDLEALIEEARRRQRRRRFRTGAALLATVPAAVVVVYLVVGRGGGTSAPSHTPSHGGAQPRPIPRPQIVFAADQRAQRFGEIYRVGLDGHSVDLSRSPAADARPVVSPDGRWVAFLSDRSGYPALYVVGVDGRGLKRLSPNLGNLPGHIVWSTDGQIVWSSDSRSLTASAVRTWTGGLDGRGTLYRARTSDDVAPSPDGRLLAFTVTRRKLVLGVPGGPGAREILIPELRLVDAAGRTRWRVPGGEVFTWSKTGRLAVGLRKELRVYDEQGNRLASFPAMRQFAWSPDGDRLASIWRGHLEVRRGGTGLPIATFRARALVSWPASQRILVTSGTGIETLDPSSGARSHVPTSVAAVSSDGSRLASTAPAYDPVDLRVDGRTLVHRPACPEADQFAGVQFTPDGRSLVYQTDCGEPPANLYAVDADGSHLRRLTATASDHSGPGFSPDGRRIAFTKSAAPALCNKGCPGGIWVADADGRHARALTHPRQPEYDASPSWSPDGKRIVFSQSTPVYPALLYVVDSRGAGGRPRHIRPLHVVGVRPAWGPARIAYVDAEAPNSVWTIRPDGRGKRRVATGRGISSLAWSRDGRLAFLDVDGTAVHIVGAAPVRLPLKATGLTWSADGGRLLLAAATGTAPTELYTLDLRTRRVKQITFGLGDIAGMSWR